jgi:hypothetical protein
MPVIFTIFLISFFVSIFITIIGLLIYHFSFNNSTKSVGYDYNPNIEWLNAVIEAGLPVQYSQNPPPELPH